MTVSIVVDLHGPVFGRRIHDLLKDALHDSVRELVALGERWAKERAVEVVYSHRGAHPDQYRPTGRWLNSLHGEMTGPLAGTIDDSRLVYGPWLEGVSSRNESTRFKGYATFRHVYGQLDDRADEVVEKHVRRAVARID